MPHGGEAKDGKKLPRSGLVQLSIIRLPAVQSPRMRVYYGLRQPLSLFTALICLTLAKTALRRLIPARGTFSGLEPPLLAYTGFIQMRAA